MLSKSPCFFSLSLRIDIPRLFYVGSNYCHTTFSHTITIVYHHILLKYSHPAESRMKIIASLLSRLGPIITKPLFPVPTQLPSCTYFSEKHLLVHRQFALVFICLLLVTICMEDTVWVIVKQVFVSVFSYFVFLLNLQDLCVEGGVDWKRRKNPGPLSLEPNSRDQQSLQEVFSQATVAVVVLIK